MKIFVFSRHFPCYNRISVTSNIKNSGLLVIIQDGDEENSAVRRKLRANRPFYRYCGHIEFIRFKELLWDAQGALAQYLRSFLGKKGDHVISKHCTTIFFFHYNFFLGKLKEKLARKARVNTDARILDRPHAPLGIP